MISFLCLLIAVGVMVYVGRPLFTRQGIATAGRKSRHAVLGEQRDALYAAIRELDFDHRMGKLDDEDYRQMRGDYTQQAVTLLKEIDRGNGKRHAAEDVEQEVALFRKRGGQAQVAFCSSCGAKVKSSDRFCAQCGAKVGKA